MMAALAGLVMLASSLQAQYKRGVNLAGPEFGDDALPGKDGVNYTFNSEASYEYFAEKGFQIIRVPVLWERLQHQPFGALDQDYLAGLQNNLIWAGRHGLQVIIDLHNDARYRQNGTDCIIDNPCGSGAQISTAALTDLWVKLSEQFREDPALYGYGIMNEPHDLGQGDWKAISQAVVTAIRATGDESLILIGGDSWSSVERWEQTHGPQGWINDPANNFMYEGHEYFDTGASGTYNRSYQDELNSDPDLLNVGARRLAPFVEWCRRNNVRGFLGEFGVPQSDGMWLQVLDRFLDALDAAGMNGTYWAAGEWWGRYPLSVHPEGNFTQDRPQMAILRGHLGMSGVTVVSAASFAEGDLAPGMLASLFGSGFTTESVAATELPLPTSLGGVEVEIEDQQGQSFKAALVYVSPAQVNIVVPEGLALGNASVKMLRQGELITRGQYPLRATAPGLFAANGNGKGAPAAGIVRLSASGEQTPEFAAEFDPATHSFKPRSLLFGAGDRLFLVLYGTGLRVSGASNARLTIGASELPILYIGDQQKFPGLDQVNVELPSTLAALGDTSVELVVDGKAANALTLHFD